MSWHFHSLVCRSTWCLMALLLRVEVGHTGVAAEGSFLTMSISADQLGRQSPRLGELIGECNSGHLLERIAKGVNAADARLTNSAMRVMEIQVTENVVFNRMGWAGASMKVEWAGTSGIAEPVAHRIAGRLCDYVCLRLAGVSSNDAATMVATHDDAWSRYSSGDHSAPQTGAGGPSAEKQRDRPVGATNEPASKGSIHARPEANASGVK